MMSAHLSGTPKNLKVQQNELTKQVTFCLVKQWRKNECDEMILVAELV